MAKGEACLIWLLATQLVEEENVMQRELQRKKERIKQKLAIASSFGKAVLAAAGGGKKKTAKQNSFTGSSILASIGL